MFKTPQFWTKKNLISFSLWPLSWIYFLGFSLAKFFAKPQKVSKPVICIGNLIAGGSGKTPTAIAIGKILREMKVEFAFLSRGYANDGVKFLMLEKGEKYDPKKVGDEPLLLSQFATTFISQNRFFGADRIDHISKFKAILLDDGMQNNDLKRDLNICVVDGNIGFGNEFMIPAGPMRERLTGGLKKSDLVILIGEPKKNLLKKLPTRKLVHAKIIPANLEKFSGKKLIAFCGLGYPKKFFDYLEQQGLEVIGNRAFPDHHSYQIHELEFLCQEAKQQGATLITTKKDWIKFSESFKAKIDYLDIELQFADEEKVKNKLTKVLASVL